MRSMQSHIGIVWQLNKPHARPSAEQMESGATIGLDREVSCL